MADTRNLTNVTGSDLMEYIGMGATPEIGEYVRRFALEDGYVTVAQATNAPQSLWNEWVRAACELEAA